MEKINYKPHTEEFLKALAIDFAEGKCANLGADQEMQDAGIAFCYEYISKSIRGMFFSNSYLDNVDWQKFHNYCEEYKMIRAKFKAVQS